MDLPIDHEQLKPHAKKPKHRRAATGSSPGSGSHNACSGLEGTKPGVTQKEANIPITTRENTPLDYESRSLHQQQEDNPLLSTASARENTGTDLSESPPPLDLKAIVREYIRKKEEGVSFLSYERKEDGREPSNSPVDATAVDASNVFQGGGESVASTEKKPAVSTTVNVAQNTQPLPKTCKPNDSDVLLGRGRAYRNHPGNKNLKKLVKQHRAEYETAYYRDDKTNLSWMIVFEVTGSGGRFLRRDKTRNKNWIEVTGDEAREKVSHAMRDERRKPAPTPPTDPPPPP